jgi:hypothetical protein
MILYKTNEDKDKPNMSQMRLDGMTEINTVMMWIFVMSWDIHQILEMNVR